MSTARSTASTLSSVGPSPRTLMTANEQEAHEYYTRMIALEKELRVRDSQVEQLSNDKKALEKSSKNKEVALLNLTTELIEAKKRVSKLDTELSRKNEESKMLLEGEKSLYLQNANKAESVKNLEIETINDGQIKLLPVDLYHHVMRLENELHDRNRVIGTLEAENNTISKLLKLKEEAFLKLADDLVAAQEQLITTQDPVVYENRIRELSQSIVELQEENKMLLNIQKVKTQALEDLTRELNIRGATDQYVDQLKRELRIKDKENADLREATERLEKDIEYYTSVIGKYKSEEVGIPFHLWQEERRLLQLEVHKQQDARDDLEKIVKNQKQRITQLQESMNVLLKSCENGQQPAKVLRDLRRSKTSFVLSSASPSTSLDISNISANESLTGDGLVEENTVPLKLYELLEKNVQKMSVNLASKENLLAEKDEATEVLEKKIDVLIKARAADVKKSKQIELELKEQIKLLQEKFTAAVTSSKEVEGRLRTNINNLKKKNIK